MTMEKGLIERARKSLEGRGRQKSVMLRRAASDAYYAVFHGLCRLCADQLVGANTRKTAPWQRVYRALEHRSAKAALISIDLGDETSGIETIRQAFITLQDERHKADYDPISPYRSRDDIFPLIVLATEAITAMRTLPNITARTLAVYLLFKKR